jgi:hypothetical protein
MPHAPCGMRWIVLPENLGVKKKTEGNTWSLVGWRNSLLSYGVAIARFCKQAFSPTCAVCSPIFAR